MKKSVVKYRTKQARLMAIVDAYRSLWPGPWNNEDVASWATEHGLWPVPPRTANENVALAWELNLRAAVLDEQDKRGVQP